MKPCYRVLLCCLAVLAACESGKPLTDGLGLDTDGDGVVNGEDCAPNNADVWGDQDGDGWLDARCLDAIEAGDGYPVHVPGGYTAEQVYLDCDDENGEVHPGGTWTAPDYYEHRGEVAEGTREVCKALGLEDVPTWAYDGVDNDCDGSVDVPDFDGDAFLATEAGGGDCDDCITTVNPGVDEELEEGGCPVYAYDGIDNDCDGADLTDLDGDGQTGRWDEGSECGATRNQSTDDTPMLSELTAGNDDCYDKRSDIYLGAPEFCDWVDHDCNGTGDALNPASEEVALNGFEVGEDGERLVLFVDVETPAEAADEASGSWGSQTGRSAEEAMPGLQAAVPYLALCSEVHYAAGVYEESVTVDLDDLIALKGDEAFATHELHLVGIEEGVVLIGERGPSLEASLGYSQAVVMRTLALEGGDDGDGGVVVSGGTLDIEDVSVSFVDSDDAAPLTHRAGTALVVESLSVADSSGAIAGGLYAQSATINISSTVVSNTDSVGDGGGITLMGFTTATVSDVSMDTTIAGGSGGALYGIGTELIVDKLNALNTSARLDGGGVYIVGDTVELNASNLSASSSTLGGGGAVFATAVDLSISDLEATDSTAFGGGGCLAAGATGSLTMEGVTLQSCVSAENGGGVYATGTSVSMSLIEANSCSASGTGGGVYAIATAIEASELELVSNSAEYGGGASFQGNDVSISVVAATGNSAVGGDGGGLLVSGHTLDIAEVVGVSNTASWRGGTAALLADGTLEAQNLESSDSTAESSGGGFHIAALVEGTVSGLTVVCDDEAATTPTRGGGLTAEGGSLFLSGLDISYCEADDGGGAYLGPVDTVDVDEAIFLQDEAPLGYGGGVAVDAQSATLAGLTVMESAALYGGGLASLNSGSVELDGVSLRDNWAFHGGGAYMVGSSLYVFGDSEIAYNTASLDFLSRVASETCDYSEGGGMVVVAAEAVQIEDLVVSDNNACRGGGVMLDSVAAASITGSSFERNSTQDIQIDWLFARKPYGGGVYSTNTDLSVAGTQFIDNSTDYYGGGIASFGGGLSITTSFFAANMAITQDETIFETLTSTPDSSDPSSLFWWALNYSVYVTYLPRGGAIYMQGGRFNLDASEFIGNYCDIGGQALSLSGLVSEASISSSVFYGVEELVVDLLFGSGSSLVSASEAKVDGCTLVDGGGVYSNNVLSLDSGSVENSILAGWSGTGVDGDDDVEFRCSVAYDLGDSSSGGVLESDLITTNPLFVSYSPGDGDPGNDDLTLQTGSPALSPDCSEGEEIGAYGGDADWSTYPF